MKRSLKYGDGGGGHPISSPSHQPSYLLPTEKELQLQQTTQCDVHMHTNTQHTREAQAPLVHRIHPVCRFESEGQREKGDGDSWAKTCSSIFSRAYIRVNFSNGILRFDFTDNAKDGDIKP